MSFTETEKVSIRKHLGYPAYGSGPGGNQSWRFFKSYGLLEFRLQHLSDEEEVVVRDYLAKCDAAEQAINSAGDNLDTAAAAVWTRNPRELEDRERFYRSWRLKLAAFFDLRGPLLDAGAGISWVV